jgi:3-hydroxyisobutyrate dehydrogenase
VGNDDDLRAVVLGADGAFAGMTAGAVFVDHTTASAEVARELARRPRAGAGCTSSTRRSPAARLAPSTALLTVMCGGDAERLRGDEAGGAWPSRAPSRAWATAAPGSWPRWSTRWPSPGSVQGLSEAIAFGQRAGLDMNLVLDVIGKGAAQSWQMDNRGKTMVEGQLRLRLRGGLDAQGPGPRARRGAPQRRQAAASRPWSTSSTPTCRSRAGGAGTPPA